MTPGGRPVASVRPHRVVRLPLYLAMVVAVVLVAGGCSGDSSEATAATGSRPETPTTTRAPAFPPHAQGPSTGCGAATVVPGISNQTITSGGKQRAYQLDVPAGYDGTAPYGIVFGLHSLTVDYRTVAAMSGFADMHPQYRFIGVAPSGLSNPAPYWNAAPVADNYDVTFISDLLDHLEATLCVDTAKVFSVGMSNGAQMSSLLACRMPERIAAIGAIAGVEFNQPCDGAPVPVIAFHGMADPIVPFAGGGLNSVTIASQSYYHGAIPAGTATPTGVEESMTNWARHNRCDGTPVEDALPGSVHRSIWQHCKAPTQLYAIEGAGHAWPGKPQPAFESTFGPGTTAVDATRLIWKFFFGS